MEVKQSEDFTALLNDPGSVIEVEGKVLDLQELVDSLILPKEDKEKLLIETEGQETNYYNTIAGTE